MALPATGRLKPVPVQWFAGQSASLAAIGISAGTTDGADVLAGAVDPVAAGSSASTDGADSLAASVGPVVAANSAPADGADVAAAQVGPLVAASSARTDGADTAAAALTTVIDLGSTYLDGADLLAATAGATTDVVLIPYRIPRMSDITTVWNVALGRGDWVRAGASLQSGADVVTAVLISLFTDRIANVDDSIPDGTTDPRGWWADDPQRPIGSRLWLLGREKQLDSIPQRVQDYCTEALQWMVDDGVVAKFNIAAAWIRPSLLGVQVTAYRSDGSPVNVKFSAAWNLTGVVFTVGETPLQ